MIYLRHFQVVALKHEKDTDIVNIPLELNASKGLDTRESISNIPHNLTYHLNGILQYKESNYRGITKHSTDGWYIFNDDETVENVSGAELINKIYEVGWMPYIMFYSKHNSTCDNTSDGSFKHNSTCNNTSDGSFKHNSTCDNTSDGSSGVISLVTRSPHQDVNLKDGITLFEYVKVSKSFILLFSPL